MVFGLTEMRTATEVEGIFRLSGSEKRIKELKTIFDSPDRYGKGLVWDGYTVHDASNVFRRYLNDLPEPVVPLDLYDQFRQPLRGATKHAGAGDAEGPQFVEGFDEAAAISRYQQLITELPPLNRQLLLYILDLLAVFAAKSEVNRMNSQNLAAIFQPGMLSHPDHAMAPEEYRLNQCVLIFLIENQDHFLIGMQGTAADEKTKQEVEQGTPLIGVTESPVTPTNAGSDGLGRTPSNASAAAVSVRRDGMIRRNRSVSSRHSRNDSAGAVPVSPAVATTPTSGLARSNTLPSKKSPAIPPGRFQNANNRQPNLSPSSQVPTTRSRGTSPSPTSLPPSAAGASSLAPSTAGAAQRSNEKLIEPQPQNDSALSTPVKNLQTIFQRSPLSEANQRPRNKLKKRAPPGSVNPSAQSSTASLPHSNAVSPRLEPTRPADAPEVQEIAPTPIAENIEEEHPQQMSAAEESADPTPPGAQVQPTALQLENSLRPKKSPPTSLHSSFNDGSELGQVDDPPQSLSSADQQERERRKRWRLSRGAKKEEGSSPYLPLSPRQATASSLQVESSTSVASVGGRPRKSLTNDSSEPASSVMESQATQESISGAGEKVEGGGVRDGGREESKGPIGWIKNKYREAKETHEQRRAKSPPGDGPSGPGSTSRLSFRGMGGDLRGEEERAQVQQVPAQQVAAQQVAAQQTTVQGAQQAASQAQQVPAQGAPQGAPQQETPSQQAPAQSQPAPQPQSIPEQQVPEAQPAVPPPARESLTPSPAQQGSTIMPVPEEPEPEEVPEKMPEKMAPQPQVEQEAQAVPAQSEPQPQTQPQTQTQTQPSTVPEEPEKEAQAQVQTETQTHSQPPATVPEEKAA